jgi:hypothetical protein
MDPYLENPDLWPDVHNRLLGALADELGPRLRPHYWAQLEERTYIVESDGLMLVGRPDVTVSARETLGAHPGRGGVTVEVPLPDRIREVYLEVKSAPSGEVVTVLELLSPTNKRPGEGRRLYEHKRLTTLSTRSHLVEVDLLRGGEPRAVHGFKRSRRLPNPGQSQRSAPQGSALSVQRDRDHPAPHSSAPWRGRRADRRSQQHAALAL